MKTKTEELFDVVIYEKASRKIDAIIGTRMRSWGWHRSGSGCNTAELRVQTGLERINNEHYDCQMVEAGRYEKGDTLP